MTQYYYLPFPLWVNTKRGKKHTEKGQRKNQFKLRNNGSAHSSVSYDPNKAAQ